jgi:ribosomal protein S18 acetylase RimI-like enzyme
MAENKNPLIILKEYLDHKDYEDIDKLQKLCLEIDKTSLKLEIDYKLTRAKFESVVLNNINEFMYYNDKELIGYIGIGNFGGTTLEVNGMVHPDFRRRGIFKRLFQLVKEEFVKGKVKDMLLLSDNNSVSGQEFIKSTGACHEHTEYEMYLRSNPEQTKILNKVVLRKANNKDAKEIAYQDSIYFDCEINEVTMKMPEEEEKHGKHIYVAEVDNEIIGKVNLEVGKDIGGIFGLGVKPEYRSKGYGRGILLGAVEKLKEYNSKEIMLQVAAKNNTALNLYKSCGFVETSTMDYYQIKK